jgi:hypothetical protein
MSRRAALLLSCFLWGAPSARAEGPSGDPTAAPALDPQLVARVRTLEGRTALDSHAKATLEQAKRALEQGRDATIKGDADAAKRAQGVAEAALTLAERLNALAEERALSRAASERTRLALARKQAAEVALAKERARLSELSARENP